MVSNELPEQQARPLPPASAPDALEDIPGADPNLLPVSVLSAPLRIEVPMWLSSRPSPERPETLRLYWNGVEAGWKRWTARVPADDLYIEVPVAFLNHGSAIVNYTVELYNGSIADSERLMLTLDRQPPVLGANRGQLVFPELVGREVNADYLEDHGDVLHAQVPDYDVPAPGDTIVYYWNIEPFSPLLAGERTLSQEDLGKPLIIEIPGSLIRERGDGPRYVFYAIRDRAGNFSSDALPQTLTIAAQPAPRALPLPEIPAATGSGRDVSLDLVEVGASITVKIPQAADIRPDEAFGLQWGDPELFRSNRFNGQAGLRTFTIPARNVAAMSGKVVSVYYDVEVRGQLQCSETRRLKVIPIPMTSLPIPRLAGLSGGTFDRARYTFDPPLTLDKWKLIGVDQRVNIVVIGAGGKRHQLLDNHAVTSAEVKDGIGKAGDVTVPLTFLNELPVGQLFFIEVTVSFDAGQTWPSEHNFERLELVMR